jgi:hypothetical protein
MKIKTSELTGPALAYAVAQITPDLMQVGLCFYIRDESGERVLFNPAENWSQAGPIIERERVSIGPYGDEFWAQSSAIIDTYYGPTPLIAAMRCYVASKLGDEVDVPEELI